jgi:hypothetical protein
VENKAFGYKTFVKSATTEKLFTCLTTGSLKCFFLCYLGNRAKKVLLVANMTIKDIYLFFP